MPAHTQVLLQYNDLRTRERAERYVLAQQAFIKLCAAWDLDPARVVAKDRHQPWLLWRWTIAHALKLIGFNYAEIAAALCLDHSTIISSLKRVQQQPDLLSLAERAVYPTVADLWYRLAVGTDLRYRAAVGEYLTALVAEARLSPHAYDGLYALAIDPVLRARAYAALGAAGLVHHGWRIREHARQAGIRWEE